MNASEPREDAVADVMTKAQEFASSWSLVGGPFDDGTMLAEAEARQSELRALVAALAQQGAEPVAWQFKGDDGKWYGFTNDQHRDNTIADGRWEIRALCVCHCAAQPGAPR